MELVLKTSSLKGLVGSNPTSSAIIKRVYFNGRILNDQLRDGSSNLSTPLQFKTNRYKELTMKELVYLSAPYSDKNQDIVESRIATFCEIDAILCDKNIYTVSPLYKHLLFNYATLPSDWNYWKTYCETLILKCDKMIVIMLPGWEESVGVKGEIEFCKNNIIPIEYIDPNDIYNYFR